MNNTVITAIISAISSVVTVLIAAIIAPLTLNREKRPDATARGQSKAIRWLVAGGLVLGAVLGYLLTIQVILPSCLPFAPTTASITSPSPGSEVSRTISLQGTSCHIQNRQLLWGFLKPDQDFHYYPADGPATISSDRKWSTTLMIGPQNSEGEGFSIFAVLADQATSAVIQRTALNPDYPGFQLRPNGILDQVHVLLK